MRRFDVYQRLFRYLKPYWRQALLAYGAALLAIGFNLYIPRVIEKAIDEGIVIGEIRAMWLAAGTILGLATLNVVNQFAVRYLGQWLTFKVAFDVRNQFYNAVQQLPFSFHDGAHTGDLMSRATSDVRETEIFIGQGSLDLISTVLLIVGVIVALLLTNPGLAIIAMIPLPILIFATIRFGRTIRPKFKKIQEQMGELSSTMQESLTGIRVVKSFAREPYEQHKFDTQNEGWFEKRYAVILSWANNWPLFTFLLATSVFLLLWLGGPMALEGTTSVGSLFAMISYVLLLNGPVQRLGFLSSLAATAGSAAERIFYILDMDNEVADRPDASQLGEIRGEVTFKDVGFAYRGEERVLDGINFTAEPGQTVALIGPTGSGKSTIINLLPRFYNPIAGQILVDGTDIQTVTMSSLRRHIGIVLQSPFLFSMTIADNIAYGRPEATREQIITAAKAARAHGFISEMPDGYDTQVGERGVTLSGGQKQRVAIARALLANTRILVLDDSTSSVDTETEYLIQQALAELMEGRTTFVIAQRLLTLKNADQILVLDHGRIVERGTHQSLLAENGLYREIYDLQLRDQEEFLATRGGH